MYDGSGNGAGPRIVQPKYEYDPHGVYQDLNVQAWAQYYASGGTDLAGAGYFLSIPGLTEHQSVSADANASEPSQPIASGSQTQHRSPRGPRSIRSRRGVVSLLEFLHIGSSKKQRPSVPAFTPFNHQPANNPPPLTPNDELTEEFAGELVSVDYLVLSKAMQMRTMHPSRLKKLLTVTTTSPHMPKASSNQPRLPTR